MRNSNKNTIFKKKISIVIPVYKSGPLLSKLYNRILKTLSTLTDNWEIVLVDDGSNDGTFDKMLELRIKDNRIKLVRFAHNLGQHHATLCGIQRVKGDYIFTMDDDLQNPPESIPNFIKKIDEGYDMVIGRIDENKKHSWWRNFASNIMQSFVTRLLRKPKNILLSPIKCMSKRAQAGITSFNGKHVYIPALIFNSIPHDRICNIPVEHHSRQIGKSNYTIRKLFKVISYLFINYSTLPLRIIIMWGLFLSFVSVVFALFILINSFFYQPYATGWSSLGVLISFLSGNILLCIGVLGEYISRILEENSRSPQFPIFEEYL